MTRGRPPLLPPALLALADGTVYRGHAFGARAVGVGEVCFNTSITGYQEILTDPSYAGQMVVMTYTQIGNVGVNPEDEESPRPFLQGFIVKEIFHEPSNWRSAESLDAYMRRHGIPGIAGIDTRALVRRIRDAGAQVGVLSTNPGRQDAAQLVEQARRDPGLEGRDLAAEVTCDAPYDWAQGRWQGIEGQVPRAGRPGPVFKLVALDYGIKKKLESIVRVTFRNHADTLQQIEGEIGQSFHEHRLINRILDYGEDHETNVYVVRPGKSTELSKFESRLGEIDGVVSVLLYQSDQHAPF